MSYIAEAFHRICRKARPPRAWYVCLMEEAHVYLGPWEGGTWGNDTRVVATQAFPSKIAAEIAADDVAKLALMLTTQARKDHGEHCLREMEWLDERGLDADYLPEPDGPTNYYVIVSRRIPQASYAPREYS